MLSLKDRLIAQIAQTGPMNVAEYMHAALYDPQHGYYARTPKLGADGDFITAPEISQMFGELIGLWCVHEWHALGAPDPFHLIELGPGRGVLMQDALRAARIDPAFVAAARVIFVDVSAPLRAEQGARVPGAEWIDDIANVDAAPSLIIANEFLDCLPIRQLMRTEQGWCERLIGAESDTLRFGLGAPQTQTPDAPPGWIREWAPALPRLIETLAQKLAPGRALFIDYGYASPEGADTLQAVRAHQKFDPLATPGNADLTAHVDFSAVARAAHNAKLEASAIVTQSDFLRALGLDQRAEKLARIHPERAERIAREHARLTAPDQMGELFKVICLSSPGLPAPAGF